MPASPRGTLALTAVGWTVAGFGMGLGVASTSLAVMALSPAQRLGRNTSSLQTAEGLGNALVAGLAGSIFHGLHTRTGAPTTFGWVFATTAAACLVGVLSATRIGAVANSSAAATAGSAPVA